ncbi:MAG TPA: 50S ribosomal protein L30 [Candidatus Xenobia bacterium]|nr:50S ribosomal protein L30 [Candidatus Xenobia bacterium]
MARRKSSGKLKIKWVRSWIACTEKQRACVRGLGLRRLNDVVERPDTPAVRGLVASVPHLVRIVEE